MGPGEGRIRGEEGCQKGVSCNRAHSPKVEGSYFLQRRRSLPSSSQLYFWEISRAHVEVGTFQSLGEQKAGRTEEFLVLLACDWCGNACQVSDLSKEGGTAG